MNEFYKSKTKDNSLKLAMKSLEIENKTIKDFRIRSAKRFYLAQIIDFR